MRGLVAQRPLFFLKEIDAGRVLVLQLLEFRVKGFLLEAKVFEVVQLLQEGLLLFEASFFVVDELLQVALKRKAVVVQRVVDSNAALVCVFVVLEEINVKVLDQLLSFHDLRYSSLVLSFQSKDSLMCFLLCMRNPLVFIRLLLVDFQFAFQMDFLYRVFLLQIDFPQVGETGEILVALLLEISFGKILARANHVSEEFLLLVAFLSREH